MKKYPQIYVAEKFQKFLQHLTTVGKPTQVDKAYIKKLGYKSSYDENFLHAIKFIGLVEDKRGGAPTELWGQLRTDLGGTLAKCLRLGYSDLFDFYPNANLQDDEALSNYFRGNSDGGAEEVTRMVTAFRAIRVIAEFNNSEKASDSIVAKEEGIEKVDLSKTRSGQGNDQDRKKNTIVNVNIQLQLPADTTGEIYDKFFEAMKKHGLV